MTFINLGMAIDYTITLYKYKISNKRVTNLYLFSTVSTTAFSSATAHTTLYVALSVHLHLSKV